MADRRMFHRLVVESDKFLDLPIGAQALYFHLGMQADDDGFVAGPRLIARQLRRPYKDLQALIDAGFLLDFDGIVVLTHWRMANQLRNDRVLIPKYPELARKLYIKDTGAYTKTRPRKGKNLLTIRKNLIKQYDRHLSAEKRGAELKRDEKKKEEMSIEEKSRAEAGSPETGKDGSLAQDTNSVLKFMNGKLGKGVILLSEEQMSDLLEKIGLDSFDYYTQKLSDFILKNNCKVRNHYETILKWWNEDRRVNV